MKKINHRLARISKTLHKEIANILQLKIKDPRININITISGIDISKDFSHVKVFFSCLKENENSFIKNILCILNNSVSFIKYTLKKKIKLRVIPNISFFYDNSIISGINISKLINSKNV